jgi:ABC-type Na+ efflux pump permease subunit
MGLSMLEKVGDRANPILVKETRQALKSRQFVSTFLLLLLASWVASVVGIVWFGNALEFGQAGRTFFGVFYSVLSVAILVIVPFGAFRSLLGERDENTWELLSITALTPRQIVWGKLLSALVQVFIYYSAITPFIAFTSLLQGFDFAQVTYLLVLLLIVSLGYTMTALLLGTQARQKHTQVFMTLGMLVLAGNGFFGFLGIVFSVFTFVPFDDRDFWLGNALFLVALSAISFSSCRSPPI